jgi:hypothetical protein
MAEDRIQIETLEDGTIRVDTSAVSPANHASAEQFIKLMAEMNNGGSSTRVRHGHAHHHDHEHVHEDH